MIFFSPGAFLVSSLKGFEPIVDATGKITGYKTKAGADTVFPFSNSSKIQIIGTATNDAIRTFDIKPMISDYSKLTNKNFFMVNLSIVGTSAGGGYPATSVLYDSSTGIVTIPRSNTISGYCIEYTLVCIQNVEDDQDLDNYPLIAISSDNISASNYYNSDTQYRPSVAIDGNNATRWVSTYTSGNWIKYDFGSIITLQAIKIVRACSNNPSAQYLSFSIQVSNDGINWETVLTTPISMYYNAKISLNNRSARYIRLIQKNGESGMSVTELQFFGKRTIN